MGMAGFIWTRRRTAPWEGYSVQNATLHFLAFYVIALFILQIVSFFIEFFGYQGIAPHIANTAHITGGLIGLLSGYASLFAARGGKLGK